MASLPRKMHIHSCSHLDYNFRRSLSSFRDCSCLRLNLLYVKVASDPEQRIHPQFHESVMLDADLGGWLQEQSLYKANSWNHALGQSCL